MLFRSHLTTPIPPLLFALPLLVHALSFCLYNCPKSDLLGRPRNSGDGLGRGFGCAGVAYSSTRIIVPPHPILRMSERVLVVKYFRMNYLQRIVAELSRVVMVAPTSEMPSSLSYPVGFQFNGLGSDPHYLRVDPSQSWGVRTQPYPRVQTPSTSEVDP